MYINVERVENQDLKKALPNRGEHSVVKNTITEALKRQANRYGKNGFYNASLSSYEATRLLKMDKPAEDLLQSASNKLQLSARAYFKTIKVAQTIADLEGAPVIKAPHVAEALTYRRRYEK
jgi:magnesium chelatase family protein